MAVRDCTFAMTHLLSYEAAGVHLEEPVVRSQLKSQDSFGSHHLTNLR